jgi:hypothetical protein
VKTAIAIFFVFATTAFAQFNPADFRIVDGTLYNIKGGAKWEDVAWSHNAGEYYTILVVRKILKDGALGCDEEFYDQERNGGIVLSRTDQIILKNYPGESYIGMKISKCRAMRLPNKPGDTVNTYDYGTEPTQDELKKLKDEADERQKAKADADAKENANEVRTSVVTNMAGLVQDIRVVNGQAYDVTTSKEWVSITIPTGTGLLNANQIAFRGTVHPIDINLALRVASAVRRNDYETVVIHNFPYDPKYFYNVSPTRRVTFDASFPLIQTRLPLTLRVFPLSHPTTNWNALGEMKIIPARPDFDFGLQGAAHKTLDETLDDQRRAAAEKADDAKTAVQAKVLKSNQDLADKGDEYGLLRMGERYRDGDGVPKDLAKAKDYLTKATTAGSPAAADELSKLNQPSTNSPATQ